MGADAITPFRIAASDEQLADLKRRLAATRWPDPAPVDDWSQGIPLAYVQEVCAYWERDYDWRAREARINSLPQFTTAIDGCEIHFVHVRSKHENAVPLVITHGWPGSIVEFLEVIGPLTDPTAHGGDAADAFHVVCPSLPGYGFSGKPRETGWGVDRIADAWGVLMRRLGYERYVAQGGDWGSMVTTAIGIRDPEHCRGIHLNMPIAPPDPDTLGDMTAAEQAALAAFEAYEKWDSGYSKQQSTRPQTLGYGLVDSPAGQAAWILEKFWSWTNRDGHPEDSYSRDQLLDNVMMYWLPATGASSGRLYWESFRNISFDPLEVPVGCSIFPKEIFRTSKRWAEKRFGELLYWNELDRGGHFAAFEQPELYVQEIRACFRKVRS